MRLLVTGGRDYDDNIILTSVLNSLQPDTIIVGDCPTGADWLTVEWAKRQEFEPIVLVYKADWNKHGKAAGPIRNQEMVNQMPWLCLAFPGGKGTWDCMDKAQAAGIPVLVVKDAY